MKLIFFSFLKKFKKEFEVFSLQWENSELKHNSFLFFEKIRNRRNLFSFLWKSSERGRVTFFSSLGKFRTNTRIFSVLWENSELKLNNFLFLDNIQDRHWTHFSRRWQKIQYRSINFFIFWGKFRTEVGLFFLLLENPSSIDCEAASGICKWHNYSAYHEVRIVY